MEVAGHARSKPGPLSNEFAEKSPAKSGHSWRYLTTFGRLGPGVGAASAVPAAFQIGRANLGRFQQLDGAGPRHIARGGSLVAYYNYIIRLLDTQRTIVVLTNHAGNPNPRNSRVSGRRNPLQRLSYRKSNRDLTGNRHPAHLRPRATFAMAPPLRDKPTSDRVSLLAHLTAVQDVLQICNTLGPSMGLSHAGDARPSDSARYKISKVTFCSRIGCGTWGARPPRPAPGNIRLAISKGEIDILVGRPSGAARGYRNTLERNYTD
jgi:hypothetical protein